MIINKREFTQAKINCHLTPGKMLKVLRELQSLTQGDLAEKTGISQSNISAIENDIKNLGRERALILAHALRVHPSVLLFPDFDMRLVA
jgi:transcriptional regulator with XRE-family HTH domain